MSLNPDNGKTLAVFATTKTVLIQGYKYYIKTTIEIKQSAQRIIPHTYMYVTAIGKSWIIQLKWMMLRFQTGTHTVFVWLKRKLYMISLSINASINIYCILPAQWPNNHVISKAANRRKISFSGNLCKCIRPKIVYVHLSQEDHTLLYVF